jgi:mannosyl-3-phosphoglycerate phosphatase
MKALFFADIDGTLIDHNTYCHDESLRGIDLLREKSIPLICISSKTFEEMQHLMKELNLHYPFAFENGSGIAYPSEKEGDFNLELNGPGIEKLIGFLPELEELAGKTLRGITSLSEKEIADITGLDLHSAARAKKRMTTLPFVAEGENLLTDAEILNLNEELRQSDFYVTRGGRFNHLMPAGSGKGEAVKKIIEFYKVKIKNEILTAAAGDSMNDIPMLESVDYSYVIRKPGGNFINFMSGKIMNSAGPSGFSEAVNDFIKIIAG